MRLCCCAVVQLLVLKLRMLICVVLQISTLCLDWQQRLILESAKASSTPQQLVKSQGTFLNQLENAVLMFRERLRNIFEKVLNSIQDHEQHVLNLTRRLHLDDDDEDYYDLQQAPEYDDDFNADNSYLSSSNNHNNNNNNNTSGTGSSRRLVAQDLEDGDRPPKYYHGSPRKY